MQEQDCCSESCLLMKCSFKVVLNVWMSGSVYLDRAQTGNTNGSFRCITPFPVEPTYSPQLHSQAKKILVYCNCFSLWFHRHSAMTQTNTRCPIFTTLSKFKSDCQGELRSSSAAVPCQTTSLCQSNYIIIPVPYQTTSLQLYPLHPVLVCNPSNDITIPVPHTP